MFLVKGFFLVVYYSIGYYLPDSYMPVWGKCFNAFRVFCIRRIFKKSGKKLTINRRVFFGSGLGIEIGDYSGIGANTVVPSNISIGSYVMMGPEIYIHARNHKFSRIDIPIKQQGATDILRTVIQDDCWLGARVIITPGRTISQGSIVGTGAVVTKDFESYSIIGGNPARLIRKRTVSQVENL